LIIATKLKGEEHATLHKPPNHKLFDNNKPVSPVLQKRIAAQNASSLNSAPVFNLTLRNEFADIFCPHAPGVPTQHEQPSNSLLHLTQPPGTDAPLADFCVKYDLCDNILKKLQDNSYTHVHMLHFVMIDELKQEMGFKLREIAALRDAVDQWSVPR
jgi:hypothetical protein